MDDNLNKNPELQNAQPEVQPAQEVVSQPAAPVQEVQPVTFAEDPAPKKSKTPIIIAAVVGGIVLISGIVFAAIMLLQPKNFDAIVDKDIACELSQSGLSINIDGKFSKDKKLTMKINFLVSAETTADYEVVSTEGSKTKLKITNAKTKAIGLDGKVTEQDSSSQTNGEMILYFENFSKDKTFKISSEQAATVGTALNCKLKN